MTSNASQRVKVYREIGYCNVRKGLSSQSRLGSFSPCLSQQQTDIIGTCCTKDVRSSDEIDIMV